MSWRNRFFFAFFMVVVWVALFVWSKSEFITDFNWYIALVPWWSIAAVCLFLLGLIWVIVFRSCASDKFKPLAAMAFSATMAFVTIFSFLVLLALNLEALYKDEPMYSWVLVATPLIIFKIFSVCACCFVAFNIN